MSANASMPDGNSGLKLKIVLIAVGAALVTASAAIPVVLTGGAPPANALYLAPGGSDASPCTQGSPCLTIAHAYSLAVAGTQVFMAAGTYSSSNPAKNSAIGATDQPVVFKPSAGAGSVKVNGEVDIAAGANAIEFDDLKIESIKTLYTSSAWVDHLTLRRTQVRDMFLKAVHNFQMLGGEVGPSCCHNDGIDIFYDTATGQPDATNLLFDGVFFHDVARRCTDARPGPWNTITGSGSSCQIFLDGTLEATGSSCIPPGKTACVHVDGFQLQGVNGFTFRNNTFENVGTQQLFFQSSPQLGVGNFQNIDIENNMAGPHPTDEQSFSYNLGDCGTTSGAKKTFFTGSAPVVFRYNSWVDHACFRGTGVTWQMTGNVGALDTGNKCNGDTSGVTGPTKFVWSHNVFTNAACGSTDTQAASGFVSTAAGNTGHADLHLQGGARAIDFGDPLNFPATDLDGDSRPLGGGPDSGADEAG